MPKFWDRLDERIQENATGILGTIAFHLVLILIFLIVKISTEKSRMEDLLLVDFEETQQEMLPEPVSPDPEFEEKLIRYLAEPASNIPVNLARQIDRELSTEDYVRDLEQELDANRPEEIQALQEKLKELEEMQKEELSLEGEETLEKPPAPYEGPTNIFYELKNRYHIRLPVPVYKCEGAGMIVVKIAVDQRGKVVQAETDQSGDSANDVCFSKAAVSAALGTRFNADYSAPVRQAGSITYHFIAQ